MMETSFNAVGSILKKLPVMRKTQTSEADKINEKTLQAKNKLSHQDTLDAKFNELIQSRTRLSQDGQDIIDLQNRVFWLLKATQEAILHDRKKDDDAKISLYAMTNHMNIFLDTLPVGEGLFQESDIEAIREILTHAHRSGNKWSERGDVGMSVVYTLCNVLDTVGLCLGWSVDGMANIAISGAWNIVDSAGTSIVGATQSMREKRLAGAAALAGVAAMLTCTIAAAVEFVVENNAELAAQLCGVSFAFAMATSCAAELIHRDACLRHKNELINALLSTAERIEFAQENNDAITALSSSDEDSDQENSQDQDNDDDIDSDNDSDSKSLITVDLQSVRSSQLSEAKQEIKKSPSLKETIEALRKETNSVIMVREGVKILKAIASELNGIAKKLEKSNSDDQSEEHTNNKIKYKACQEKYNQCRALLDSIAIENAQAKNHGRAAASWVFCGVAMSITALGTFIVFPPAAAIVSNILNVVTAVFRHAVKHAADDVKNVTQAIQKKNLLLADLDKAVNSDLALELKTGTESALSSAIDNPDLKDEALEGKIPEIASTFRDFYRMPNAKNLARAGNEVIKTMKDGVCGAGKLMGKFLLPVAEEKGKVVEKKNIRITVSDDKEQYVPLLASDNDNEHIL